MSRRVRFWEEAPGVQSMTRLCAFLIVLGVLGLIAAVIWVAVTRPEPEGTIAALAAPLVPMLAGLWGALRERHPSEAPPDV